MSTAETYGEWLMRNNRPEAKLKPYGWGIVDKDGDAVIGTCIEIHRDVTALKELATITTYTQKHGLYDILKEVVIFLGTSLPSIQTACRMRKRKRDA